MIMPATSSALTDAQVTQHLPSREIVQSTLSRIREIVSRLAIAGLYAWLLIRTLQDWHWTGRLTGVVSVIGFSLALGLTLARRTAFAVDGAWLPRMATLIATVAPMLMRPGGESPVPDLWTAVLALIGSAIVWTGLFSLGRSFAFLPAHRGKVAQRGLYRIVRHPLYAGYLWMHLSWVLAYPIWWNLILWMLIEGSQVIRLHYEEKVLSSDPAYRSYQQRVRWRLLPGLY
ncbi:MAG TPA: methyltransferase [Vicinamibacterales bacterium]|nr:methyltransferase [Vicinamibacterales bacterium]